MDEFFEGNSLKFTCFEDLYFRNLEKCSNFIDKNVWKYESENKYKIVKNEKGKFIKVTLSSMRLCKEEGKTREKNFAILQWL